MSKNNKLPQLRDLHSTPDIAFKNDQLNLLLNQPPHASWIKKHPMAKKKDNNGNSVAAEYMPIDKVEFLLTRIFQKWKVEVLDVKVIFQSVVVTVRLHYMNPVDGMWYFHDGVGAKSIQMDAGAGNDITKVKDAGVMMAVPSAKSYAIKDAAEHLGTIFGRDLNRRDTVTFRGSYEPAAEEQPQEDKPTWVKVKEEAQQKEEEDFEL